MDNLNSDQAITLIADSKDMPAGIIRTPEEVAEIRRGQAELARQEAEKQDLLDGADAVGKLTPLLTSEAAQGVSPEAA